LNLINQSSIVEIIKFKYEVSKIMFDPTDKSNHFNENTPAIDLNLLQRLISQQAERHPLFENIAILGCGYVGSALAEHWQEQGHFVTGTTTNRKREFLLAEAVSKVVVMNGNDFTAVHSLLQGQNTVVVSVAPTGSQEANTAIYETTYIDTAKNLAIALSQNPQVKQVIYLSSCSVYGDRQGEWVSETTSIDPPEYKSQIICEAEQIILQAATDRQKVCVFRLGGIYGPDRELVRMFGGLAGMTMPGKGDRFVNWIHRDDIIGAIEFARSNGLDGIYNLVDDSQMTIKEQIERVCNRYNLPLPNWDTSKLSLQRKSLQVSNHKLKAAGYDLIHPQLLV
jgi:nucleoside-diphosphate-sugar epimerase